MGMDGALIYSVHCYFKTTKREKSIKIHVKIEGWSDLRANGTSISLSFNKTAVNYFQNPLSTFCECFHLDENRLEMCRAHVTVKATTKVRRKGISKAEAGLKTLKTLQKNVFLEAESQNTCFLWILTNFFCLSIPFRLKDHRV